MTVRVLKLRRCPHVHPKYTTAEMTGDWPVGDYVQLRTNYFISWSVALTTAFSLVSANRLPLLSSTRIEELTRS